MPIRPRRSEPVVLVVLVVLGEHHVEALQTIGTSVGDNVARHKRVIERPLREAVAGSLAFDTKDLIRHVHAADPSGVRRRSGHTAAVRIVAGSAKGRRLIVPEGSTTRPTTDRVREATFNALFSLGAIEDATFVDLFAGSGALGLEALSRGASHVTFVERDRAALAALNQNIETLGFGEQSTVVGADSMRWLKTGRECDVLLADPPYDFDDWFLLLEDTTAELLVAESGKTADLADMAGEWEVLRERRYGSTVVTILRRPEPQS